MKKIALVVLLILSISILSACSSDDEPTTPAPTDTPVNNATDGTTTPTDAIVTTIPALDVNNTEVTENTSASGWKLYLLPMSLIKTSANSDDADISTIIKYSDEINATGKYAVNTFVGFINGTEVKYAYTAKDMNAKDNNTEVVVYVTEGKDGKFTITDASIDDMDVITGAEKVLIPEITEAPAVIQAIEVREETKLSDEELDKLNELEKESKNNSESTDITSDTAESTETTETTTE